MQNLPLLVVDKSFAHAINGGRLAALSRKYSFLVPSAFYYEVFDTEPAKRLRTLSGFGEFRRVHLPTLLRREAESGEPASEADLPRLTFNPRLRSLDWKCSPEESATVRRYATGTVNPLISFWESVIDQGVVGFSAAELSGARGTEREFVALCETLRDPDRVRMIAGEFNFPHASILNESWLQYRKFQTWILQGLILWHRYKRPGDVRSMRNIEHDTHDTEYLMLGLHAGNLATAETSEKLQKASMGWRFKLLKPQGQLLTPESA